MLRRRRWIVWVVAAALFAGGCASNKPSFSAPPSPSEKGISLDTFPVNPDPVKFAAQVKVQAKAAGVKPQLLMAIIYNEDYKPHDPDFERGWQKHDPEAGFGIVNMHKAAFEDTRRGRDFASREWTELPDDPSLAIEAAAWYLHDLEVTLGSRKSPALSHEDLLAAGYNAGPGTMKALAGGTKPGEDVKDYLDRLHKNWDKAAKAIA